MLRQQATGLDAHDLGIIGDKDRRGALRSGRDRWLGGRAHTIGGLSRRQLIGSLGSFGSLGPLGPLGPLGLPTLRLATFGFEPLRLTAFGLVALRFGAIGLGAFRSLRSQPLDFGPGPGFTLSLGTRGGFALGGGAFGSLGFSALGFSELGFVSLGGFPPFGFSLFGFARSGGTLVFGCGASGGLVRDPGLLGGKRLRRGESGRGALGGHPFGFGACRAAGVRCGRARFLG